MLLATWFEEIALFAKCEKNHSVLDWAACKQLTNRKELHRDWVWLVHNVAQSDPMLGSHGVLFELKSGFALEQSSLHN